MKSKKKVVILTESQVKSLMNKLREERDQRSLLEIRSRENRPQIGIKSTTICWKPFKPVVYYR